ncbi:hypothetical protein AAL_01620 [Moelleriella libera RCEF 2490]|uniref:Uncharacterized protein n=1 Tax=Moelleriella libera RCEF 2490 TaxID=1081109 RepID=A0A166UAZ5_9HYPO|nr:hypothetical protein AAL_01620 [Moelleriella libera RCEF 2490]
MAPQKGLGPNLASERTKQPFTAWDIINPDVAAEGGPWTWTHYGVYIPRLPAPFQYLNVLVMFGAVDLSVFRHDEYLAGGAHAVVPEGGAERLTTVMSSTAAEGQTFSRGYDSETQCQLSPSSLRWGRDFAMEMSFPRTARVRASFDGGGGCWGYTLDLQLGQTAVWFISVPYYDHFSLPVTGTLCIADGGGAEHRIAISGALEFARCKKPPSIPAETHRAVAKSTNFFIYHVVAVRDDDVQILWGEVRNAFAPPRKFAHVRRVSDGRLLESFTTELQLQVARDELVTDAMGRATRVPREFRAVVAAKSRGDEPVLVVAGTVNSSLRPGAGGGYVAGYEARIEYRGRQYRGSASLSSSPRCLVLTPVANSQSCREEAHSSSV